MTMQPEQIPSLCDQSGHRLGRVVVDRIRGDGVVGSFAPGQDFAQVAGLFERHHEAVNEQLFSLVEELDDAIEKLGLRVLAPGDATSMKIEETQIGSARISFRIGTQLKPTAGTPQGTPVLLGERLSESSP